MSTDDLLSSLESIQDAPAPVNVDGTTSTNSSFTPVPPASKQRFLLPYLSIVHSKLALKILPLLLLLIGATVGSVMVRKQGFGDIRQRAYGGQACITSADCDGSGETCSNGTCVAGIADASPSTSPAPSPSTDPCTLYDPDTAQCISYEATPVPSPSVSPSPSPTPDTRPCTLADPETTECLSYEPVPAPPVPSPSTDPCTLYDPDTAQCISYETPSTPIPTPTAAPDTRPCTLEDPATGSCLSHEPLPSPENSPQQSAEQRPCTLYDPDTAQCISYETPSTPIPTPVSTPTQGSSKLASPVKFSTQNRAPCLQEDPATGTCLEYGPVPDSTETPEPTPRATTAPIPIPRCYDTFFQVPFFKTCVDSGNMRCANDGNETWQSASIYECDEAGHARLKPEEAERRAIAAAASANIEHAIGPCIQEDPATGNCLEYGPATGPLPVPTPLPNAELMKTWCSGILVCEYGCIPTNGGGFCATEPGTGTLPTITAAGYTPSGLEDPTLGVTGVSDGTVGFGRNSSAYASGSTFNTTLDESYCYDPATQSLNQECLAEVDNTIRIGAVIVPAAGAAIAGYALYQVNPALAQKVLETGGNIMQVGGLAYGIGVCNSNPGSEECANLRMGLMADPIGSAQAMNQAIMGLSNDAALVGKYGATRLATMRTPSPPLSLNSLDEGFALFPENTLGMAGHNADAGYTQIFARGEAQAVMARQQIIGDPLIGSVTIRTSPSQDPRIAKALDYIEQNVNIRRTANPSLPRGQAINDVVRDMFPDYNAGSATRESINRVLEGSNNFATATRNNYSLGDVLPTQFGGNGLGVCRDQACLVQAAAANQRLTTKALVFKGTTPQGRDIYHAVTEVVNPQNPAQTMIIDTTQNFWGPKAVYEQKFNASAQSLNNFISGSEQMAFPIIRNPVKQAVAVDEGQLRVLNRSDLMNNPNYAAAAQNNQAAVDPIFKRGAWNVQDIQNSPEWKAAMQAQQAANQNVKSGLFDRIVSP